MTQTLKNYLQTFKRDFSLIYQRLVAFVFLYVSSCF